MKYHTWVMSISYFISNQYNWLALKSAINKKHISDIIKAYLIFSYILQKLALFTENQLYSYDFSF